MERGRGASIGEIEMGRAGVAFELTAAPTSNVNTRDGNWTIDLREGAKLLVVRGRGRTYAGVLRAALRRAERTLDFLSVAGGGDLGLNDATTEHVAWWTADDGLTVRIASTATLNPRGRMTLTIRDRSGRVVRAPRQRSAWHESYRYFRMSMTAPVLSDAYRNAHLALENILNAITPQRPDEREGRWFKRALRHCGVPLGDYASDTRGDPVKSLFRDLYVDLRVAIFHSKGTRGFLLPRDEVTRDRVQEGLVRTRRLYLAIAAQRLGTRRSGGLSLSVEAARAAARAMLDSAKVVITSDESVPEPDETLISPTGAPTVELPDSAPVRYRPFRATKFAWTSGDHARTIPFVRRALTASPEDQPYQMTRLEGRLQLDGVERLEVELSSFIVSGGDPRPEYP